MLAKRLITFFLHSAASLASLSLARGLRLDAEDLRLFNSTRRGTTNKLEQLISTPSGLFNTALVVLLLATATFKIFERSTQVITATTTKKKPSAVKSLQIRFLIVFWLLRCADWLQGPYFYELYASKVCVSFISKLFVAGFASAALFGPLMGRAADQFGRKKGTLAFCIFYAIGAASTKSSSLAILFLGRILSGIGTSLMFSAPEAWLVAESQQSKDPDGYFLGEMFGLAYAGDSIVAILAGQLSLAAASQRGPTGPFELSIVFLALGGLLVALLWGENVAESTNSDQHTKPSIKEALQVIRKDPKIMLVGAAQSLFEASMYIFIMQWPPSVSHAIEMTYGRGAETPYGSVFSCFMACCLLGSTLFGHFANMGIPKEESAASMLTIAALAMGSATTAASLTEPPLVSLMVSFLVFEGCVGFYFPSLGALRSKYVPDAHRSIVMGLFGIPLNVMVVSVFLANQRLGVSGALGISTAALNLAAMSMYKLHSMTMSSPAITRYK